MNYQADKEILDRVLTFIGQGGNTATSAGELALTYERMARTAKEAWERRDAELSRLRAKLTRAVEQLKFELHKCRCHGTGMTDIHAPCNLCVSTRDALREIGEPHAT